MPLSYSYEELATMIDSYAGSDEAIGKGEEVYVQRLVIDRVHEDNNAGSEIHPLSCLHITTGVAAPHYTIQSGWIQFLCVKKMGLISDQKFAHAAAAFCKANSKQGLKAAQEAAWGHAIQTIDNLHFYKSDSTVTTSKPNLQVALNLVQQATKAVGPIGAVMNIKDDDWLKRSNVSKSNLADFCLKSLELPAWGRLKTLLDDVIAKPVLVDPVVLRKQRVNLLINALTRVTG